MAEHTPERWRAGFTTDGKIVVRGEEVDSQPYICLLLGDATRANAERIVACVNFCAGTATEYLDGAGNLGQMLATAGAGVNAELLAACQEAADRLHDNAYGGVRLRLLAAIARATAE